MAGAFSFGNQYTRHTVCRCKEAIAYEASAHMGAVRSIDHYC
jgi:hypothetical protein